MVLRIYQLPPAIANQIAAGEVIERPASVVKELLENSLDAGANLITVEIGYGGLNQIRISDNGVGIVADDLPLAIAAHATSKITTLDDLYAIESMGFRGEALASIASVAKVSISSKPLAQQDAMMLQVKNSGITISPCARTTGTTIDVVDLFFNAPVRKRFLKNEKLEFQAIETVVKRFSLSAPHIGLILKHNNKQMLSLPAALDDTTRLVRMTKIFGSGFIKDAQYLDVESGSMRLYGWISGPDFQRSQNDRQWIYVNQRMVRDKLLNHALKQAYDGLLHPGRFSSCLLYFTLDSSEVDVNVHPTKHEVRFQQPRLVHDFFISHLTTALHICKNQAVFDRDFGGKTSSNQPIQINEPNFYNDSKLMNLQPFKDGQAPSKPFFNESENPWVILNSHYILLFIQGRHHLIDIVSLQKNRLLQQLIALNVPLANRPLLIPVNLPVSQSLMAHWDELGILLKQLGLETQLDGQESVLIRSVPVTTPYLDIKVFFKGLASQAEWSMAELINLLSQSQCFTPELLSCEERIELNHYWLALKSTNENNELWKTLTVDDCRMLLSV